jgi:hypothetical protein
MTHASFKFTNSPESESLVHSNEVTAKQYIHRDGAGIGANGHVLQMIESGMNQSNAETTWTRKHTSNKAMFHHRKKTQVVTAGGGGQVLSWRWLKQLALQS